MKLPYLLGGSAIVHNSYRFDSFIDQAFEAENLRNIRITAANNLPYIHARFAYADRWGNEYIRVMGPMYALMTEAAAMLNCTLEFQWHQSLETIRMNLLPYMPHLTLYNFVHSSGLLDDLVYISNKLYFN